MKIFEKIVQFLNSITDYQKSTDSHTFAFSIPGKKKDQFGKPKQEDAYFISEVKNEFRLLIVADGLGGQVHGEYASRVVVETFREAFEDSWETIEDVSLFLRQEAMNAAIKVLQKGKSDPAYQGCATTLSGFIIRRNAYFTVNVGDSRVYKLDKSLRLEQMTTDHTTIQEMLESGQISEAEAGQHPLRHQMNSAIGMPLDQMRITVSGPYTIKKGELLLTCTDGIHDYLNNQTIQTILQQNEPIELLVKSLVQTALEEGSTDNITACVYQHIEA